MTMRYVSTNGAAPATNFAGTVLTGLATDGGLYLPEVMPTFSSTELDSFVGMSYPDVAFAVMQKFAPDFPEAALREAIDATYTPEIFGNVTNDDDPNDIVPVRELYSNLHLVRLSNGPTLAFKDLALQLLGRLFEIVLQGGSLTVLGATSGDTGSAAIEAMRGRKGIRTIMLSPRHGMSPFQQAQMWGVNDPSVSNYVIDGDFDACQRIVKALMGDLEFKERHHLGAVNSINWARIAAQVVYYVWAWAKATRGNRVPIDASVPTGNFGNILAAYIARMMGVPFRRLILATNVNDVLTEFFATGIYRPRGRAVVTTSPSMDITEASNFVRYLYYVLGRDTSFVARELVEKGCVDLSNELPRITASGIVAHRVDERQCRATIIRTYTETGYIIDPHTANGMAAAHREKERGVSMLVMETAQPCKFDNTIYKILDKVAKRPVEFWGIEQRPHVTVELPADVAQVRARMDGC